MILGSIGVSVIISILLQLIFGTFIIKNKLKPFISVFLGLGFGVVCFYYDAGSGFKILIDYLVQGFMTGATAVGLYEMVKK